MSGLQREALKNKYGGLPPAPRRPGKPHGGGGGMRRKRDYTPLSWQDYFDSMKDVYVNGKDRFRVYQAGSSGPYPLLLLLHGGGHSALTWSVFTKAVTGICHCQVLAIDLRGHAREMLKIPHEMMAKDLQVVNFHRSRNNYTASSDTTTQNDSDLSVDTLSKDVGDIVKEMYRNSPPSIVIIGHSMGGAIAVHVAVQKLLPSLAGLAVIDVVEGTAMEALSSMQSFLRGRPSSFQSLEQGIEWCVRSGQVHNVESARISMVGQLVRCSNEGDSETDRNCSTSTAPSHTCETISEESEDAATTANTSTAVLHNSTDPQQQGVKERFTWRIDLSKTDQFWEGWFKDLSSLFLSCPAAKLLIIAGVDRLDKDLVIGQMQGKFQMEVLPRCGHCVHEDAPDKVAEVVATFLLRLKLTTAKENFLRPMPSC